MNFIIYMLGTVIWALVLFWRGWNFGDGFGLYLGLVLIVLALTAREYE